MDLGTTYTAAAVCRNGHVEIVPLSDRAAQAPSVVYRTVSGEFVVGESADRHAFSDPERVAREFKRRMGDETQIIIGGTPMSARALSKELLRWVVAAVEQGEGEPPERMSVAFPANWGPYRRELMAQVVALDVHEPAELCTEPEAAAVHFAASGRLAVGQVIALYDLGGGTFDAAVLRRGPNGRFELLGSPEGIEHLGGVDFDEAVFDRVRRTFEADELDPEDPATVTALARLRRDCVEAKEALSHESEVSVPVLLGRRRAPVRLTRSEFDELIFPLVEETVEVLERVIRRAGLTPADLSAVLLTGGSSRVPLVSEVVTRRLGRPVVLSSQPKLCVAMGAALIAAGALAAPAPALPATSAVADEPPVRVTAVPAPATEQGQRAASAPPSPSAPAIQPTEGERTLAPTGGRATDLPPVASATVNQPVEGDPAALARRRRDWHRWASPALGLLALVLLLVPPKARTELAWDRNFTVSAQPFGPKSRLQPTVFGKLPGDPVIVRNGRFDLRNYRIFLAGPVPAQLIDGSGGSRPVLLRAAARWSGSRLLTVQTAGMALCLLFSFAYAESILRGVRRRHTRVTPSELLGLLGAGAVAGVGLVLAVWALGDRLPGAGTGLIVVACVCAAVGLLGLAWQDAQSGLPVDRGEGRY